MDDLWAIAECYGFQVAKQYEHFICEDALPRFEGLFKAHEIKATFFVVGRDLENEGAVENYCSLAAAGHRFGNHSYSHPLNFRMLKEVVIESEVARTEALILARLGMRSVGFRAPGYGASPALNRVLGKFGYLYDSSVMAGPYGSLFRFMDRRLQVGPTRVPKSQYSRLSDAIVPLAPAPVNGSGLIEIPVATSPLLRLPFQAGVCIRLGEFYFKRQLNAFRRNPALPLVFLIHAADLADFSQLEIPLLSESSFFSRPIAEKAKMLSSFLKQIQKSHTVQLTEDWITSR